MKSVLEVPEALKDFRNFLHIVWKHLGLPSPTPIQYDIARQLQTGPRRMVIEAFRGVGKSYITSAFVVHQLLLDPAKTILVVSASKQRADDFSTFTLRLIEEIPILQHLKPQENQRYSKVAFDVGPAPAQHAPSVTSKGITSQITGSRADLIVADDIEVPNNSMTQALREKLAESVKEFDAVIKPGGRIVYLGTPQSENSIYNLLPDRGYEIRVWPARRPKPDQEKNYGNRLAKIVSKVSPWEPTDPKRFDEDELQERELSFGRSGFALQFMLDTALSDADRYPLKINDLVVMDCCGDQGPEKIIWSSDPQYIRTDLPCVGFNGDRYRSPQAVLGDWVPFTGSVMSIDPSGRGADETAYAVVKMLNGFLYVSACGGVPGGYGSETLQKLADLAKEHKVTQIIVESNFGDGMFTELLKPYLYKTHGCAVEEVRHSIQKERRIIDTLEPVMNQHRLVVDPKVVLGDIETTKDLNPESALKYQLFYQMSRVMREKGALTHDDRLDALAMAVAFWAERMATDADRKISERKSRLLDKELEKFMESARRGPLQTVRKHQELPMTWF
jgi:hypothetical protein